MNAWKSAVFHLLQFFVRKTLYISVSRYIVCFLRNFLGRPIGGCGIALDLTGIKFSDREIRGFKYQNHPTGRYHMVDFLQRKVALSPSVKFSPT